MPGSHVATDELISQDTHALTFAGPVCGLLCYIYAYTCTPAQPRGGLVPSGPQARRSIRSDCEVDCRGRATLASHWRTQRKQFKHTPRNLPGRGSFTDCRAVSTGFTAGCVAVQLVRSCHSSCAEADECRSTSAGPRAPHLPSLELVPVKALKPVVLLHRFPSEPRFG